jgi:aryl-alcohol dehydrogenase-like predicted oxidoreductase
MKFGQVAGIDKPISRVVMGTMIITAREMDRSRALLDAALAEGYNTLDGAHIYAGGESERAIGQWMQERKCREQVVVITKGCHPNGDRARVTPFDLAADLHDSLARLKTGYIDLYMLHRDNPAVPVGEIIDALNEQQRAGRIRAFAGSNWSHERLAEANAFAQRRGVTGFAAGSPNYSLAVAFDAAWAGCASVRGPGAAGAEEWYRTTQTPLFAWSSLARGLFSGRTDRANAETTLDAGGRRAFAHEENFRRLDRATLLAKEKGCSVTQIALAWIMTGPLNVFALTGAASREECRANTAALEIPLTPRERDWLDLRAEER